MNEKKIPSKSLSLKNKIADLEQELSLAKKEIQNLSQKNKQITKEIESVFDLSDAAFEAIFISEKGICVGQNSAAKKMFGYSQEEAIGKPGTNWIASKDRELVKEKMISGDTDTYLVTALRKNGSTFPAEIKAKEMVIQGKRKRVTSLVDVSSRLVLKSAESKYQNLFNSINDAVFVHPFLKNSYSCFTEVNDAASAMYGYSSKEFAKLSPIDIADPKDTQIDVTFQRHRQLLEEGLINFEAIHITKDGEPFWAEINSKIFQYSGNPYIISLVRNINQRKKIEVQLKESETRYRWLSDRSYEGILIHKNGMVIDINKAMTKITGYSKGELIGRNIISQIVLEKYHPLVISNMQQKNSSPYEVKGRRKDESLCWYEVESYELENNIYEKGARVTAIRDISARKKAEKSLALEQAFSKKILETSSAIIVGLDKKHNIKLFNHGAERITGYTKEEVINKDWFQLVLPKSNSNDINDIWRQAWDEGKYNCINSITIKSGEERIISWQTTQLHDGDNESTHLLVSIGENITEKKQIEDALWKSEEKFQLLADYTSDWEYWRGEDGNFKYISPSVKRITGYTSHEFIDNPNLLFKIILPQFKSIMKEHNQSLNQKKEDPSPFAFQIRTKNGEIRWLEHYCVPLFDKNGTYLGRRGNNRDITERKHDEFELKKQSVAIEQSPVSVVITNIDGDIEYVNPKFTELTGYTFKEAINQNPRVLNSGEQSDSFYKDLWKTLLSGNTWRGEFHNKKKNGDLFWESAIISPITNNNDETTHYLALKEDISEKKTMIEELIKAKEQAEESNKLKSEFIHNLSHEIRTPMNGILGFSGFLSRPGLTKENQQQYVKIIQNSGKQLLRIIDDILEISQLHTKTAIVNETEVMLNLLYGDLFKVFELEANDKNISLYLKNGLNLEKSNIKIDASKLNKILSNLLENALKFTATGFIELGYRRVKKDHRFFLELYVKDSGIGIKQGALKTIFDRFSQEDKSIAPDFGGLGLGLAIAKENARLLDGTLSVVSEKGHGSTFTLTIPYKPVDTNVEIMVPTYTFLIVENEYINYLYLEALLEEILTINYNLLHAKNGDEAIALCKTNDSIDFVLMDLKMPVINGYEATKKIRTFRANLPIIAQTAYSTPDDKQKALDSGCNDFISKPISEETLLGIIEKYLVKK